MAVHVKAGETSEWYTPAKYVEAAREVLGHIDLDPASCEKAQQTVQAGKFYSLPDDGLQCEWFGRVWLNPPFSGYRGQAAEWIDRLHREWRAGRVEAAIALVNMSIMYQIQDALVDVLVCVVDHRIPFMSETGARRRNSQSQMFLCFGSPSIEAAFSRVFSDRFGVVLERYRA